MHHPTDRITHTTPFVTPVVEHWLEREIAQWVELSRPKAAQQFLPTQSSTLSTPMTSQSFLRGCSPCTSLFSAANKEGRIPNSECATSTLARRPWLVLFQIVLKILHDGLVTLKNKIIIYI